MMIHFKGRSSHTVRMVRKPISDGFKFYALCNYGYTWTFLPTSRKDSNIELPEIQGFGEISRSVIYLVQQLPHSKQGFICYMDNYFSSIPLFQYLREKGIGACGTARAKSAKFPKELRIDKYKQKLNWDTRSGVVVDGVLSILWVDNGPVNMLTTVHKYTIDEDIERNRRRPRITCINKSIVPETWGNKARALLKIPGVINDYNHHMNSVDIADQ